MFSLEDITQSVHNWLYETMNPTLALMVEFAIIGVLVIALFAFLGLVLVMMERKVSSWMQLRLGPNRIGPWGWFQTVADTLKLIVKEGMTPNNVDRLLFNLAPVLVIIVSMVIMAPLMFAKGFQIWDINIGVLFVSAVSSLSVIGILMAGALLSGLISWVSKKLQSN